METLNMLNFNFYSRLQPITVGGAVHVIKHGYALRLLSLSLLAYLSTRFEFNKINVIINTCHISLWR